MICGIMAGRQKRIVFLWHNGGRLANQLWPYMSIYAYCLERGYRLENHCFFEYARHFNLRPNNRAIELLYYRTHDFLKRHFSKVFFRDPHDNLFRKLYKVYVKLVEKLCRKQVIYAPMEPVPKIQYLPPTPDASPEVLAQEAAPHRTVYFHGWLFRNPVGLGKYRKEIVAAFGPKPEVAASIGRKMSELRSRYRKVIGVHIRQGDYRGDPDAAKHCFSAEEVNAALGEYVAKFGVDTATTAFLICSDETIDLAKFPGLHVSQPGRSYMEDLFLLAACDLIIGSNSTFGPIAAYYGNIPFITLRKGGVDWEYYRGQDRFFFDKYATLVYY